MSMSVSLRPVASTFVCFGLFWGAWAVSVSDIKAFLGISDGSFGLLLSVALLGASAANAVAGSLAERWGTQTALSRSLAGWGLLLAVGAAVHSPLAFSGLLVGVIALGGAVDVVINVAATAALGHQPGRLVRFHALFNGGVVGGAIAVGVLLRAGLSWRWMWLAAALVAFVLAERCRHVRLPAGASGERHGLLEAFRAVRREGLVLLAVVFATSAMVEGGIDTWGVLFLREDLASGLVVGTAAFVVGQLVATGARLTLGPAAGSLGARRGVGLGAGLAAGGLALMASAGPVAMAATGLVVAAAGISVCWPLLLAHASAQLDRPALVIGGVTSVGYLGFVLGPAIVGWLADTLGLQAGLLVLAAAASFVAIAPTRGAAPRRAAG
ncbi:MAG: MFS transporter [Acidimicrobiia bacterium]